MDRDGARGSGPISAGSARGRLSRREFVLGAGVAMVAAACGSRRTPRAVGRSPSLGSVAGGIRSDGGRPLPAARVTLFSRDDSVFREARTTSRGGFVIAEVPHGTYQLGIGAPGHEYREITVSVTGQAVTRSLTLGADRARGSWKVIGSLAPETFGGTNSGTLLSDGRIFYCHDATDPILFDPATGISKLGPRSSSEQGCHMPTHLLDGRLLIVGGGTVDDNGNFGSGESAVATVKALDPVSESWEDWPSLLEPRWYPGLARLPDGRLLLFGGGQQPNRPRTESCEIYDPETRTSTPTGDLLKAGGFGPAGTLLTGQIFCTWDPPQLFDPSTGAWRGAGSFLQPKRGSTEGCPLDHQPPQGIYPPVGDHPDHSAIFLPDGRVVAIGIRRSALGQPGSMVEVYDPSSDSWALGASPPTIRSMPEVLQLPDGSILTAGGKKEDAASPDPENEWCQLKRAHLYDPLGDSWRRMADMLDYREYHAITLLLPDARVATAAGTWQPSINPPPTADRNIEAFSPPYLSRGPRPRIDSLSDSSLKRGQTFTIMVSRTNAVTEVVLIGMNAISHWMDGGVQRLLRLSFTQTAGTVRATVPSDPFQAQLGWYLLFVLVDGVPSKGRIVSIT